MNTVRIICALIALLIFSPNIHSSEKRALIPVGEYSTMHQGAEHCAGYTVDLWRAGNEFYGVFHACAGLTGDIASGIFDYSSYDPKTGTLSFKSRLSLGSDYLSGGRQIPSQDAFSFKGNISPTELLGTLTHIDLANRNNTESTESVRLKRNRIQLPTYESIEQFRSKIGEETRR